MKRYSYSIALFELQRCRSLSRGRRGYLRPHGPDCYTNFLVSTRFSASTAILSTRGSIVTTAQILAERAMQQTCDKQCVDWAIRLLESGHETLAACRLAAKLRPHNHFELASLRDQILNELGHAHTSNDDAITAYAVEILTDAVNGRADLDEVLGKTKDLCIGNDYQSN